ncbi:MAG: imidazole glycerol phosphate synthase subunit HisH [Leptospiraceae bacterium]|nr:imidazole glycerol phosphate synthase subunit HisH [Leptospiraceae bacterium]
MIAVIDFGMGNLHSCLKAISRYTSNYKLITNPEEMSGAEGVVLPGDGAFDRAMINLQEQNFIRPLKEYLQNGGKLFGICIGFQLLFQDSDEDLSGKGQIIEGLGFVPGSIRRFRDKAFKVPHMGWNEIFLDNRKSRILKRIKNKEFMYFIHSYRAVDVEDEFVAASCNYYEERFPVVVEHGNIFGTQFHPEKSDTEGLKILENFIRLVEE